MRRPPLVAGVDTEDDSRGRALLFGCVHWRGSFWSEDRARFLAKLEELRDSAGAAGLQVWCTNLEYDLVNLFGLELIGEVVLRFGRSQLYSARWRRIEFRDTARFSEPGKGSVAALGELVGMPKLERSLFDRPGRTPTRKQLARRCLRDAAITRRYAARLRREFAALGATLRTTLPATVFRLWEERYHGVRLRRPPLELTERAHEAYYGGRSECFALGERGRCRMVDASSMFPWAMVQGDFPDPAGPFRRVGAGAELSPTGVYYCELESELALPALPYRTDEGTVYPNGRWRGWYVGEELLYYRQLGGRGRVLDGHDYARHLRPFDRYVREFYARKQASRGLARSVNKLCLTSLYGKYGQRGEVTRCVPAAQLYRLKRRPLGLVRYWCGLALWSEEGKPPPWGNGIWSALVTARARVRLHRELLRVRAAGARALYCDTDSVLFEGGRIRYPRRASAPGEFELRGTYRRALIVGKKEYMLESRPGRWHEYAKGVPHGARREYLTRGEATYTLPVRLREAARRGLVPNVWTERPKRRRPREQERRRLADGTLRSPVVRESEVRE